MTASVWVSVWRWGGIVHFYALSGSLEGKILDSLEFRDIGCEVVGELDGECVGD